MRVLAVTNAYPTERDPASGVFVERQVESVRAAGLVVDVLHIERAAEGAGAYRRLPGEIRRALDTHGPDLVHVTYGGVTAACATAVVRSRPVLVSFGGTDLLGSPAEPLLRRATIRAGVWASRFAARRAAGVVVKSDTLRAALPRSVAPARVWTVPSGVDFERFRPLDRAECRARLGWSPARRHVLFPAAPERAEKRFWLAEGAVAETARRGLDVELHVLGSVQPSEVPIWINAADAVLLTSTHEGSPNAVKEALACDVAVVSVDVGDVRSLLARADGCVVAAPSAPALADGLVAVLGGPERLHAREQLGELSLENTARRLIEIYETLVGRST